MTLCGDNDDHGGESHMPASGDGHAHGPRIGSAGARHQKPLTIAFALTAAYAVVAPGRHDRGR